MKDINEIGVPKGEGSEQMDTDVVIMDSEKVKMVLELLDDSSKHSDTYLNGEEQRISGHMLAVNAQKAYQHLQEAHPEIEVEENE